ncbi:MAG: putative DNA binding domain-containing protein [Endomicrobium sp.]|jgi:predicted HTH transcriptional regulator|nr:putative DNA binding domain-containing protein [Endomicrobium sp.]
METNRIEYKLKATDKLESEVSAFLNSNEGGQIFIGIDDNGKTVGVENADKEQLKIIDRIKNNILPSALGLFEVITEEKDGKHILKIILSSGSEKPYYVKSKGMSEAGCFMRVGTSIQPMPSKMIDSLFQKRNKITIDRILSPRRELTFEQLKIFYEEKGLKLNSHFKTNLEFLTPEGKDNLLSYLLADENGVSIKIAKYSGEDKVDLIENEEYGYCCLIKAAKRLLDKITVENRTFTKITPKERIEKSLFDKVAIREAVINAVVHNEYTTGAVPLVEIFSNRITVTSYGGLIDGMSKEDFFSGRSMPRNRQLMRIFRDMELVEQIGSGMNRILKAYKPSVFNFTPNFLVVEFPFAKGYETASGGLNGSINGSINGSVNFDASQTKVLSLIIKKPKITYEQIAKEIAVSYRSAARIIKYLQSLGVIEREGSKKSGFWKVKR